MIAVGVFALIIAFILDQLDKYLPLFGSFPIYVIWLITFLLLLVINALGVPVRAFLTWIYIQMAEGMSDQIWYSIPGISLASKKLEDVI